MAVSPTVREERLLTEFLFQRLTIFMAAKQSEKGTLIDTLS